MSKSAYFIKCWPCQTLTGWRRVAHKPSSFPNRSFFFLPTLITKLMRNVHTNCIIAKCAVWAQVVCQRLFSVNRFHSLASLWAGVMSTRHYSPTTKTPNWLYAKRRALIWWQAVWGISCLVLLWSFCDDSNLYLSIIIHLTTTTYVRRSGRITKGMRSGRTVPQDSGFSSPTLENTPPEWPSQEEPGSDLAASAPVSDVSAPVCTNGVWLPLRHVSVAQKNKPSTMSSNVQPSTSSWTAWPDGSRRWDNRMSAQHLPRDLVRPSSG